MRLLFRPFAYLTIQHPSRTPAWVNWFAPALMAGLLVFVSEYLKLPLNLFGPAGVVDKLLSFLQSLPGFYIAALAAIATFNNEDMQRLMPGTPPTMKVVYNNSLEKVPLTRRRFLSSMFAYLTALSIALTLASIAALAVADGVKGLIGHYTPYARGTFIYVYLAFVIQMVCITLWGLFYLGERVHTPD